jgi:hypothetical protein
VSIIISEAVLILQLVMVVPTLQRCFGSVEEHGFGRETATGNDGRHSVQNSADIKNAWYRQSVFPFRPEIRIPPCNFFLAGLMLRSQDQSSAEMVQVDDSCGAWMLQSISYNPSFCPSSKNILRKTKQPDFVVCRQIVISEHTLPGQIAMLHHCRGLKILGRRCGPSCFA